MYMHASYVDDVILYKPAKKRGKPHTNNFVSLDGSKFDPRNDPGTVFTV